MCQLGLMSAWKVFLALRTQFRHLPPLMSAQVIRGSEDDTGTSGSKVCRTRQYVRMHHAENPLVQGDRNRFDSCVEMLRVHPVYRDSADPFMMQSATNGSAGNRAASTQ